MCIFLGVVNLDSTRTGDKCLGSALRCITGGCHLPRRERHAHKNQRALFQGMQYSMDYAIAQAWVLRTLIFWPTLQGVTVFFLLQSDWLVFFGPDPFPIPERGSAKNH